MADSILQTVRDTIGIEIYDGSEEDNVFDSTLITYVNSVLATLYQMGVGPEKGFTLTDSTTRWDDFIIDNPVLLNLVQTYVGFKVRLRFDPPTSGVLKEALTSQIDELEWRISEQVETFDKLAESTE